MSWMNEFFATEIFKGIKKADANRLIKIMLLI
jgi:hypothetical protein